MSEIEGSGIEHCNQTGMNSVGISFDTITVYPEKNVRGSEGDTLIPVNKRMIDRQAFK